jgi:uncharacterized protein
VRRLALLLTTASLLLASLGVAGAEEPDDTDDTFAVLVYTRTTDFRHLSIPDGIAAVEELGEEHGFEVEATEDPDAFTDENLARFAAVIFLNTTGTVVEPDGKEAFERYVRGGGGWVGVHSAADTEYEWEFYEHLLGGAYFHSHPVQQPGRVIVEDTGHPSTAHLGDEWLIPLEEYYSFVANPRDRVRVLLSIDEDSYLQDPNTTHIPRGPELPEGESGVMGDHPMTWCHEVDDGHAWYTAFGHEGYLYRTPDYREHLLGGILTAAGQLDADCSVEAAAAPDDEEPESSGPVASDPDDEADDAGRPAHDHDHDHDHDQGDVATESGEAATSALPATGAGSLALALTALALGAALALRRPGRQVTG